MSTISEIIIKLQQIREDHGDLPVLKYDTDWQCYYNVDVGDEDFVIVDDNGVKSLSVTGKSPYE